MADTNTAVNDPFCSFEAYLSNQVHIGFPAGSGGLQPGEAFHVMPGIPTWMAATGVVLIVLVSHLLVGSRQGVDRPRAGWRINLLSFAGLKALVKRPWFPLAAQSISLALFLLVLSAGIFGNPKGNIAPVLTWTWWWVLLIFFVLGLGEAFCMVCPWEAMSSLITSLSLKSRVKRLGFERPWPKWARNLYPAIALFILLTWFELGHDVTHSPQATALMGLAMVAMAVLAAIVFEKRSFCRYSCLVGRITGLYALFSPVEVRSISTEACLKCATKDCYRGNDTSTGCPTGLFPGSFNENSYCTMCTECVRACPHDNMAINLRPFASDLLSKTRFRWDEAMLAIVLLALTSFHGLTMTPQWTQWNHRLRVETGFGPEAVFTALMIGMLVAPIGLFWLAARLARVLTRGGDVPVARIFQAFAYALVPVALFYHLAHNCMHFFHESQNLLPLLSDPFGWGWNLFGTAGRTYRPWLTMNTIWYLQIIAIVIGHVYGVLVADRVARRLFPDRRLAVRCLIPLLATMVLYSAFSVWLIAQPMEMRSGM
ncbi:MAG: hypothetical protein D6763_03485 [Alphaproteobacteria bacterium]|nr:MAG: hypothetical protein D6763_03485 [Alphaproteobacteria bacterium]